MSRKSKVKQYKDGDARQLAVLAGELISRNNYATMLGKSFNDNRDIYTALGYPKTLTYSDYALRYERQDIATRIIDAPVNGCWGKLPQILETGDKNETKFEKEFIDLEKRIGLLGKLTRLDKLTGLGRYAVLFLGFSGVTQEQLQEPVTPSKQSLLYVTPFPEGNAEIIEWESDITNERYGQPLIYRLTMQVTSYQMSTTRQINVHWTRCLHVAEGLLFDDVYGTPRLQSVYNRLIDLEKIIGGSGEMYWQGAFPGFALKADADTDMTDTAAAVSAEIDSYVHKMQRYMKLQGIDVQQLSPQVSDPSKHVDVQLQMVSSTTNIPKRILLGSERGELSSSQDGDNWNETLTQRRNNFCEGRILRPLIDSLITMGILSKPVDGYEINWPALFIQSDMDKAEVASKRSEALGKYVSGGLDMLMSFDSFLEHVCEYDRDVVDMIIESGNSIEVQIAREEAAAATEAIDAATAAKTAQPTNKMVK